jgi:hypothetical protein
MLGKIWDVVFGYVKSRTWWPRAEPFVLVLLVGAAAQFLAFEFVAQQYGVRQPPTQFLASYLSIRITLVTLVVLLVTAILTRERPSEPSARRRHLLYRVAGLSAAVLVVAAGFLLSSTHRANKITVRIGGLPEGARADALTYIIYELNRIQRDWYFEIDFTEFKPGALTSIERQRCVSDAQPLLCFAEWMAGEDLRTILITGEPLASDTYFATHRGRASVISTAEGASYQPLTVYEYLAYNIVVQSIVLHLDEQGGLPTRAFERTDVSRGGVLQFVPERDGLRPTILAARLSPEEELLLFNQFGPSYLGTCQRLLTLEWLYTPAVRTNLAKVFEVTLSK